MHLDALMLAQFDNGSYEHVQLQGTAEWVNFLYGHLFYAIVFAHLVNGGKYRLSLFTRPCFLEGLDLPFDQLAFVHDSKPYDPCTRTNSE